MAVGKRPVRTGKQSGIGGKLGALGAGIWARVRRIPLWVWALVALGLVVVYLIYRNGGIGGAGSTQAGVPSTADNSLTPLGGISATGNTTTTPPASTGTVTTGTTPATGGDASAVQQGALSTLSTDTSGLGTFAPISAQAGVQPAIANTLQPFGTTDWLNGAGGPVAGTDARSDPSYGSSQGVPLATQAGITTHSSGAGGTAKTAGAVFLSPTAAAHLGLGPAPAPLTAGQQAAQYTAPHIASHYAPTPTHPAAHIAPTPAPRSAPRRGASSPKPSKPGPGPTHPGRQF